MGTRRLKHLGLCLVVCFFSVISGWAQSVHEGTITGTVFLPTGEAGPGVTVTATSPALVSGERQVISDGQGKFVFLSVPPGTYKLAATLEGFKTYTATGIVLHAGDNVDLKVKLQTGTYAESIVVTGAAPVVDTKTATVSTTFSSQLLDKLPTARNAFYDLAVSAPGMASVGGNESWLSSPSAYGSAGNENLFLVNGVNATNPRGGPFGTLVNVNYNTVEEVKIVSLGSKAEYGSFSGAAIDVLTKSGGNEYKGDVAYYSKLGSAADNATLNFGGRADPYPPPDPTQGDPCRPAGRLFYACSQDVLTSKPISTREGSVTAGGPILRDRLWFYAGYNKQKASTDTPLWKPLATYDSKLIDAKLTGDFSASQRAWVAYHNEKVFNGNNTWGQTWDPTMGYDQNTNNNTYQAQYQWVINDRNLLSGKYLGLGTNQTPEQVTPGMKPGMINWWKWIGQSIGVYGNFPYIESYKSNRKTFQLDHTHYAANFLGSHEVKYGVQYTKSAGNAMGGYFGGYANFTYPYPYNTGPAESWWWNGPESWQWGTDENPVIPVYNNKTYQHPWLARRLSSEKGGFFDDTWSVTPRLTLDLGLRYDRMTAKYGQGDLYDFPTTSGDISNLTLLRHTAATGNVFDFKDWSPRLGFAYVLTEDNRTVVRGHVGRYFAPLGVESLRRFGPDLDREKQEKWMYYLPFNQIDLNHNHYVDPGAEVDAIYRLMATNPGPGTLDSTTMRDPSWRLEVAPGTKSPYTDQFEVSLQRGLGRDYSVEVTGIYKNSKNFIAFQPYNRTNGQLWEWESVPFPTYTGYQTKVWQIKLKDYNADGKVDVDDAKFVLNNTSRRATNLNSFDGENVNRQYTGLQIVMNKRYSNRWQGMAALNWNHTRGIASRMLDQNWYIDGPMIMDTPFGSSLNDFQNNLSGPSPMTPRLMLKVNGSYTIPVIESDFGLRWRFDTGRPFWPIQALPAFATWMGSTDNVFLTGDVNSQIVADDVSKPHWMPNTSIFDFSLGKTFPVARGTQVNVSLDVLNAFNTSSPNIIGFKQADYGRVYSITSPRMFRGGVKFMF